MSLTPHTKVHVSLCDDHLQRCRARRLRALAGGCGLLLAALFPFTAGAIDARDHSDTSAVDNRCATTDDCKGMAIRAADFPRRFALTRTLGRRGNTQLIVEPVAIKLKLSF